MPLSLATPITANDILWIDHLSPGHPVYALHDGTTAIVVKQEQVHFPVGRKEALRHNLLLMSAVDLDAAVVVLSGAEVTELTQFVENEAQLAIVTGIAVSPAVQNITLALGMPGKWVKMAVKRLFDLEKAATQLANGDKSGVRRFAHALNAVGGLEMLGEIIAVDLFNDNTDRFVVAGGGRQYNGITLNHMVNIGNVLLSSGRVSGLDSWDPNAAIKNTRSTLANLDPNNEWGGYLLSPAAAVTINNRVLTADAFAAQVVVDLEFVLGPRNRRLRGLRTGRLDAHASTRIVRGMRLAIPRMRARLRLEVPLPQLIQDKANALGWNPL
jgi:hypothetical protein